LPHTVSAQTQKPAQVTLIPGDGIGPEITAATLKILAAAGAQIDWEERMPRPAMSERKDDAAIDPAVESIRRTRVALKGPLTTPIGTGHRSMNVALRKELDLYANLRPVKRLPGIKTPFENVDIVVVRENTEGLYSGLEHTVVPGVVESLKIITEKASTRIARFAFEYARRFGRKKIKAVHKANIMKLSDGLLLDCSRKVAQDYPDIDYSEVIIDNCCMQLVMRPQQFDMLLLENLYGDIVSDLCAGLVGGLGVVPGANHGVDSAIFEAVHGSAPDIAGKGIANPTAMTLSATLMLRHLSQDAAADRVENAIHAIYREGRRLTRDLGGTASTEEFVRAVIDAMQE
jgi:isocitrate dehydrogenase (NAD+)